MIPPIISRYLPKGASPLHDEGKMCDPRTLEYTVGWICALPKEQTAAIAMLDRTHKPLRNKPPADPNAYTLGSIGNHNIVIVCLPKGRYGATHAATVAAHMVRTFSGIKLVLVVGIGGGIPPKVRLGDIVVSVPTAGNPGVVQWDFGKIKGDKLVRTGVLNNPPDFLLTALSKLETENELVGSKIQEILEETGQKWPQLHPDYLESGLPEDILFEPEYEHVEDHAGTRENPCPACDRNQIVERAHRETRVHYGLIASGNRVIKDAKFRDKIDRDLGGNVLCVEMEAAGLMDGLPSLVIRGICDYADSHKNKAWQEYAAAKAAAFAKELLGHVQYDAVLGERTAKDNGHLISRLLPASMSMALIERGSPPWCSPTEVLSFLAENKLIFTLMMDFAIIAVLGQDEDVPVLRIHW